MSKHLAILAGSGDLPQILAAHCPDALFVSFAGVPVTVPQGQAHFAASFEQIGALFEALKSAGITDLVFAGAMQRPALNPAKFDAQMLGLAPRLLAAMGQGDDALLREVAAVFEEQGFALKAAHAVVPALLMQSGEHIGPDPTAQEERDCAKGLEILAALSPLDVGQAVVLSGGQVLGIETLQGTDSMLAYVADTPPQLRRGKGVLIKAPKQGQDLRFDVPSIGADTIHAAARAGLAGVYIRAGSVNVLHRDAAEQALQETGLFLRAL
ncbi:MAG: hypothetical protein CSA68_07970 [Rhodobacterales bacterium]|nr:MAG: hypothetical protein CSA68_07970 [Rhodobacterales bacterium]